MGSLVGATEDGWKKTFLDDSNISNSQEFCDNDTTKNIQTYIALICSEIESRKSIEKS